MGYDPIGDEKKEFSLREWGDALKEEVDKYVAEWEKEPNEFHRQKHTWSTWLGAFGRFGRYMSW